MGSPVTAQRTNAPGRRIRKSPSRNSTLASPASTGRRSNLFMASVPFSSLVLCHGRRGKGKRHIGSVAHVAHHGSESRLTVIHLQDLQEKVGIPRSGFPSGFDASLGFVGAQETEDEAADDGHVLGAVAGAIA